MNKPGETAEAPRRAFYGRRKGHRLRAHQAKRMASDLPRLAIDLSQPAPVDLAALFPVPVAGVRLEIGFGGGEHLIARATADPACGFIGCEPFVNGMAKALAAIESAGLRNVRLHHGDAVDPLAWLPERSLASIDLLYPDPWPKTRHRKRRFVSDENVAAMARVLQPGGVLRFATDIADYAEWTLVRLLRSPRFEWTADRADDWRRPWDGYVRTRYEAKAVREGRAPCYLMFRRT